MRQRLAQRDGVFLSGDSRKEDARMGLKRRAELLRRLEETDVNGLLGACA